MMYVKLTYFCQCRTDILPDIFNENKSYLPKLPFDCCGMELAPNGKQAKAFNYSIT